MDVLKSGSRPLFWAAILFYVCLWGCANSGKNSRGASGPAQAEITRPIPVAVQAVTLGSAASRYTTTAALEAESHADIHSRTTGVVRDLRAEEGDQVEADQFLMRLDDADQHLRVKQAKINLEKAQAEFDRRLKMRDAGFLSPQEFDDTENLLKQAKAELEVAELNLSYTEIRAPFTGRIVRRLVDLGANVANGTSLFEIMDVNPLLVRVHVPANRLGATALGQKVDIFLGSSDTRLEGRISLISPIVDPETGTVKVTAEIANYPSRTRPGDFAEIQVTTDLHENTMLVPSIAVIEEQNQFILYLAKEGLAHRRVVSVGYSDGGFTEILSGVEVDDWVVIKGQRNLRDEVPIEIVEGPGAKGQGGNGDGSGAEAIH